MGRNEHTEKTPEEKDEGPRSFSVFLQQLADGDAEGEASAELQDLVKNIRAQADFERKLIVGKLNLALKVACDERGTVTIKYEIKASAPKPKTSASVFWVTKGGNLSRTDPKQPRLPGIRDVSAPPVPARDVGGEVVAAREV